MAYASFAVSNSFTSIKTSFKYIRTDGSWNVIKHAIDRTHKNSHTISTTRAHNIHVRRGKRVHTRLPNHIAYFTRFTWRPFTITKSSPSHRLCTFWIEFCFILFRPCLNARTSTYRSYMYTTLVGERVNAAAAGFIRKVCTTFVSVSAKYLEIIFKRSSVSIVVQCRQFSSFDKTIHKTKYPKKERK